MPNNKKSKKENKEEIELKIKFIETDIEEAKFEHGFNFVRFIASNGVLITLVLAYNEFAKTSKFNGFCALFGILSFLFILSYSLIKILKLRERIEEGYKDKKKLIKKLI